MRRYLSLLLVALFGCNDVDITPQPISEANRARLERRIKPGYTLREAYQHVLGESEAVQRDRLLEPDGTVVAGLVDGPNADGRLVALYFGPGENGRIVNMGMSLYLEVGSISRSSGDYDNARALVNYVMNRR